jgi:predicted Fe-Mo cluster-binding NifX family protein
MKICVTATHGDLGATLDPRFGRCGYFVIVDPETMEFESLQNEAASVSGGAGIQAAQSIANRGIDVLITGSIGPNAFGILSSSGIKVMTGPAGSVSEVIEQYLSGSLHETAAPTSPVHAGMGGGGGRGGGGRGMGGRR